MIKMLIKEPLLHFLILGVCIYGASVMWGNNTVQSQQIDVSEGQIKHLATLYRKTWQRPPTQEELNNVVQEYVLEQAAYYEGLNLGLDKNDIVIIRRVRQKLDFVAEESRPRPTVTDEVLTAFMNEHKEKFLEEPVLSLRQVYLDPKRQGDALKSNVQQLITTLKENSEQDIQLLGDRSLFKPRYENKNLTALGRVFGKPFSLACKELTTEQWHGPISSAYGVHFVYLEAKQAGRLPELSQIRSQVLLEWESDWRERSIQGYYKTLLERYPVTIHWPEPKAGMGND